MQEQLEKDIKKMTVFLESMADIEKRYYFKFTHPNTKEGEESEAKEFITLNYSHLGWVVQAPGLLVHAGEPDDLIRYLNRAGANLMEVYNAMAGQIAAQASYFHLKLAEVDEIMGEGFGKQSYLQWVDFADHIAEICDTHFKQQEKDRVRSSLRVIDGYGDSESQ